jgi:hypothetical protein
MGHFIFLIGSKLDKICDMIRHATESAEDKLALGEVLEIKQKYVPDVDGKAVINAFQWAKARLTIECPAALVEVQRFEADSKFFRSLVVVLVPLVVWLPRKARSDREYWLLLLLCLLFCVLSCLRYAERRFKANK